VLPFKPVAEGSHNEPFELGMTDSLIGLLGNSNLIVRPVGTVRRFGSLDQDPIAAGRALAVDAVLDGTINTADGRVRVTTSLWRVADGRQLWTGKFDEKFSNIFDIQDSISIRVADAVNARLSSTRRRYTQNTEAYRLYLLGNHHAQRLTPRDYGIAIQYFRQAIALDPGYPWPYIGIATADRVNVLSADAPPERMDQGKVAAEKAVALAPELAEAHVALGMIEFFHDWDWGKAIAQLEQAHDLAPNLEDTNIELAHAYSNLGRHDDAIRLSTRAGVIDPLSPRRWALHGQILFYAGRNEESVRHLREAIETMPDFWLPHLFIQRPYLEMGMYKEVIAEADLALQLGSHSLENTVHKACAYAGLGNAAEARRLLAELEKTAATRYVAPYLLAVIHNALGETGPALTLLEEAYRTRDWRMTFLLVDPRWNNLRSEPRFIELMRKMKFAGQTAAVNPEAVTPPANPPRQ
jgi:serine/threonine-protein kinase